MKENLLQNNVQELVGNIGGKDIFCEFENENFANIFCDDINLDNEEIKKKLEDFNNSYQIVQNKTKNEITETLKKDITLDELFFKDDKVATLDIFGKETRIGFEKYKHKIGKINLEEKYIKNILEGMLVDIDKIYERQKIIDFLINNGDLSELLSIYNKGFFLGKYDLLEIGETIYINNGNRSISDNKYLGKNLIIELFKESTIEEILSIINNKEEIKNLVLSKTFSKLKLPKYMIVNLYDFKKSIKSIIEFNNYLGQNYANNKFIKSKIKDLNHFISNYKLDRDFREILLDMKENEQYLKQLSKDADKILQEGIKLGAILKIANFVEKMKMKKITFDDNKKIYYKGGYSIYKDLEDNIEADSLDDNFLNIFRAPNGSGKTFYIEKDIYSKIFAQSIGFSTVEEGNFRKYNLIIFANRMQSQSENDDNLSALGIEGDKLDEIYEKIKNTKGNVLLALDEIGSTTDEENQFKIIKNFIESINKLQNGRIINIILSTHNQILVDYFKGQKNINIGFYTFSDSKKLEKGERDSDTLNSFKRLLTKITDKKLQNIGKKLFFEIKNFLNGEGKKYKFPLEYHDYNPKVIEYTEKEKEKMAKQIKGFDKTLFANKQDYYVVKKSIKSILGKDFHGEEFIINYFSNLLKNFSDNAYSFYNKGERTIVKKYYDEYVEKDFIGPNGEKYEYFPMYFSNSDFEIPTYSIKDYRFYEIENNFLKQTHISDIRMVKERQKIILDFIEDIGPLVSLQYIETTELFIKKVLMYFKLIKIILNGDLYFLTSNKDTKNELGDKVYIDREGIEYYPYQRRNNNIILNEYYKMLDNRFFGIKDIILRLINIAQKLIDYNGDSEKIENDDDLSWKYKAIENQEDFLKICSNEISKMLQIMSFISSILNINLFELLNEKDKSTYQKIIKKNEIEYNDLLKFFENLLNFFEITVVNELEKYDNKLEDFLSGKFKIPEIDEKFWECEHFGWDSTKYWDSLIPTCLQIKNLIHYKNNLKIHTSYGTYDTDIISFFKEAISKYDNVLMSQIKNYIVHKLEFALGKEDMNIATIDGLMNYMKKFHNILLEKNELGYLNIGEQTSTKIEERVHTGYVNKNFPGINSIYIENDFKNLLLLISYAKFIEKYNFKPVKFVKERKIEIKNMRGVNLDNKNYVGNDVYLDIENPIEIINGFNGSGKTEYIKNIILTLNSAFNYGFVNADSMTIGGIDKFAYIDRIVTGDTDYSAGEQDILYWLKLFKEIEDKDFVIVNVDEIFTTMDMKYSTAFAYNFVGKLLEEGKFAIIISHNHEFVDLISKLKGVKVNKFDSKIDKNGNVTHTYKKTPGTIKNSAGVHVLKSLGIGKEWLI